LTKCPLDISARQSKARFIIRVRGAGIDDEALKIIARCKSLESLNLDRTRITDGGLAPLVDLPHLYQLSIVDTAITDKGLKQLDNVPSLMNLDVRGTDNRSRLPLQRPPIRTAK
jgi:hypothetical protein